MTGDQSSPNESPVETDMAGAHLKSGIDAWKTGDGVTALDHFLKAREFGCDHPRLHYWLALTYIGQARFDEAWRETKTLLRQDPNDITGQVMRDRLKSPRWRGKGKRIALHMNRLYHYAILRPLYQLLCLDFDVLLTFEPVEMESFSPDIVVVCDTQAGNLREMFPHAVIVSVLHGVTAGKNFAGRGGLVADHLCVASDFVADRLRQYDHEPAGKFWITGYIETDPLFCREKLPLPVDIPANRKTVLYAPTYSPGLSSVPLLREQMAELIIGTRDDISVITRPHPNIIERNPTWLNWFRRAAGRCDSFHFIEDLGLSMAALMLAADVIVSDSSNCAFQFLALDRPIVLVNALDREVAGNSYEPRSIEWTWRDVGEDVTDISDLAGAIGRSLDDPMRWADRRADYRAKLFGELTDGRAAERIVEKISALAVRREIP